MHDFHIHSLSVENGIFVSARALWEKSMNMNKNMNFIRNNTKCQFHVLISPYGFDFIWQWLNSIYQLENVRFENPGQLMCESFIFRINRMLLLSWITSIHSLFLEWIFFSRTQKIEMMKLPNITFCCIVCNFFLVWSGFCTKTFVNENVSSSFWICCVWFYFAV